MYIKSIELDGFKSYGELTQINGFDDKFNAITGLNGSGKSNILDAICFVLGISNLSHVRAGTLQDLIFKSGQGGVDKATVSITFDNTHASQCPPGYEDYREITVTRQLIMGGKNNYLLNGIKVQNKKIHDLFCSVQLNVNNPHFLIMQGKITKVLNMKPIEILAMIEEAAGTRMYEVKRQSALKQIEKKSVKIEELSAILKEEIEPKIAKLREDRRKFLDYQNIDAMLKKQTQLFECWQYCQSKQVHSVAVNKLRDTEVQIKSFENEIEENIQKCKELDEQIIQLTNNANTEASARLAELESELKEKQVKQAKSGASIDSVKFNITTEEKKIVQLNTNLSEDQAALTEKENRLESVRTSFETLKTNDEKDTEALNNAVKKLEALGTGMEVNDEGETQTLQDQFMKANQDAMQAATDAKIAANVIAKCKSELAEKEKELRSTSVNFSDYEKTKREVALKEKQLHKLEEELSKMNFSEDRMREVQNERQLLTEEVRSLRDSIELFYACHPRMRFTYDDMGPDFNRKSVKGVVCNLMKCKIPDVSMAIETAAGSRLYNVVVDTDKTVVKLLKKGNLQNRTTFIPLNKIKGGKIHPKIVKLAQNLVGPENCQTALSHLEYGAELETAMEYIFGNAFVCKDISVAKRIAFNDDIRKLCVTLDGDVVNPAGTLSGGAPKAGGSDLLKLAQTKNNEAILKEKESALGTIEANYRKLDELRSNFYGLKRKIVVVSGEFASLKKTVEQGNYQKLQDDINNMKKRIEESTATVKACKELEKKSKDKAGEIERKMKDIKGYFTNRLKEAEADVKRLKEKAEKSSKIWKQNEQDYELLKLEISTLKTEIENIKKEIEVSQKTLVDLNAQLADISGNDEELKTEINNVKAELASIKERIKEKNKDVQKKSKEKENLCAKNENLKLKIKAERQGLDKMEEYCKNAEKKMRDLSKKFSNHPNLKEAEKLSSNEGSELEKKIKANQEQRHKLSRVLNTQALTMFEEHEKKYMEVIEKMNICKTDKENILKTIKEMDVQKENSLKLAFHQVSKDFGSIFGTLLPGANAKLEPPKGKQILQGLEIKVALGDVWKENLSELSGGQRSLAALSLILAMLLFKPAPLYILDEVDAALDMSHTQNIGKMLKTHFKQSQFIVVSLKDGMFSNANVLFRTKFVNGVSTVTRTVNK
ncbi:unnamed protein product [Phyllotreta striolata]|uniref:Structural maintenance of chromosomes protein n=1 Tax=Phyllotreta striolata TaxID=444603 RepID=A0A9N9TSX7_PHYSR|nr:unnamed protein product [Phyllotreta striolata]